MVQSEQRESNSSECVRNFQQVLNLTKCLYKERLNRPWQRLVSVPSECHYCDHSQDVVQCEHLSYLVCSSGGGSSQLWWDQSYQQNYSSRRSINSSGSGGSGCSIAPHLGLPSLPQCIAFGDRWTGGKIKNYTDKNSDRNQELVIITFLRI